MVPKQGKGWKSLGWKGLATADMGSTARATKVADPSVTASSIEMPVPSLSSSTPKMRAAHIAPYFVGAGEGDVEGQDLIAVQGCRQFLVGAGVGDGDVVQLVDGIADGRQKR